MLPVEGGGAALVSADLSRGEILWAHYRTVTAVDRRSSRKVKRHYLANLPHCSSSLALGCFSSCRCNAQPGTDAPEALWLLRLGFVAASGLVAVDATGQLESLRGTIAAAVIGAFRCCSGAAAAGSSSSSSGASLLQQSCGSSSKRSGFSG
ncbi:hypothetical protein Emag_006256 [Eimeria magna]